MEAKMRNRSEFVKKVLSRETAVFFPQDTAKPGIIERPKLFKKGYWLGKGSDRGDLSERLASFAIRSRSD
jgi:hypothetical protein